MGRSNDKGAKTKRGTMFINDGYITGALRPRVGKCPLCEQPGQRVIDILNITVPESFGVRATILWNRYLDERYDAVGLTCGCYAKFHRQVAHITGSRMK